MKINDVIRHFGSVEALSIAAGVSHQAVYKWKRDDRIPLLRQYKLQEISNGKLKRAKQ